MVRETRKSHWVAYEVVRLPDIPPFAGRRERDNFFLWLQRDHPELMGRRIEVFEEYIPDPTGCDPDGAGIQGLPGPGAERQ